MQLQWVSHGSIANSGTCCATLLRTERSSTTHLKSGKQVRAERSPISNPRTSTSSHSRSASQSSSNGMPSVNCPLMAQPEQNMFHSCSSANMLGPNLLLNPEASPAALARRPLGANWLGSFRPHPNMREENHEQSIRQHWT